MIYRAKRKTVRQEFGRIGPADLMRSSSGSLAMLAAILRYKFCFKA